MSIPSKKAPCVAPAICSWFGMRCLQSLVEYTDKTRVQESLGCLRRRAAAKGKPTTFRCSLMGALWSVPPTPEALGEPYHVYPVTQAKLSLLLRLRFSARWGQGEFLWGNNGKCLSPWIVSGSAWVFLHALRGRFHKIFKHMCNQKWLPIEPCKDRHFQPSRRIQTVFHEVSIIFFRATKTAFFPTSACPRSSWIKLTLKCRRSFPSWEETSIIQSERSCTAECYLVINVKNRINSMPESCEKVWAKATSSIGIVSYHSYFTAIPLCIP